ncbi:MAG: amino acid ABC transporter substrate-binding protein [Acidimicrobiales bacterium]|nr:amino acid ABC transporter substrate-binding protein [Acidimicrobiales bacterium]
MKRQRWHLLLALLVAFGLVAAACGDDDDTGVTSSGNADSSADSSAAGPSDCSVENLPLHEAGMLTVATGEPVFEPWMVDDDPSNGQGFESALVYALAEELGFAPEDVTWVRTTFDGAIAPGDKDYDFNIQQFSISEERDAVVDFSDGYYQVEQALVAAADSDVASAGSLADLKGYKLGAAIATTSLDYIDFAIEPDSDAAVFDDNAAAKAAFDAGSVDGLVFDLPTAYYITAVEIPEAAIVGVLPRVGDAPEELGMLFADGSELVPCINSALAALRDAGTLEAIENEWLNQGGDIPTLSE